MKKFFFLIFVLSICVIGFSACTYRYKVPGTYNIEGGYVLTISDELAVRLKAPNGKVYKGSLEYGMTVGDYLAEIEFNEKASIKHLSCVKWIIDDKIKYINATGGFGEYREAFESKDEDKRLKIESYTINDSFWWFH